MTLQVNTLAATAEIKWNPDGTVTLSLEDDAASKQEVTFTSPLFIAGEWHTPPEFKHDCDMGCKYLGNDHDSEGGFDMWVHFRWGEVTKSWYAELIRRYSSDGPDYRCWTYYRNVDTVPDAYKRTAERAEKVWPE